MSIAWHLLQPVDTGAQVQQGFATGAALMKNIQTRSALGAYMANPDDPQAYGALAYLDPQAAAAAQGQHEKRRKTLLEQQELERRRSLGARAITDPTGASNEALGAGDLDLAKALREMGDKDRERVVGMYKGAAPFAYQAMKLPYEQRKGFIEQVRPQLEAAGWTPDKIAAFDPTDASLGGIVQSAMTLEQAMARDEITYKEVGPGARLVPFDATGRPLSGDTGTATGAPAPSGEPRSRTTRPRASHR